MYPVELITEEGEVLKGILYEDGFFEEREVEAKYVATPTFFNAHAHLLDSIAECPFKDLIEAIKFKFEVLNGSSDSDLIEGVRSSVKIAEKSGTSAILNFTEMGVRGYNIVKDFETVLPLTRPSSIEEAEFLVNVSAGFGMSSARDHDYRFLEDLRELARKKRKLFAIHAGEKDDEDVEGAIALEPDLIVHMNMASLRNLRRVMDMDIPVVSCIRSNAFFGLLNLKNYEVLSEYDKWMLGTDNAMVCSPSMIDEIRFASYVVRDEIAVFKACVRGFSIFNTPHGWVIFRKVSKDPISCITRRVKDSDIVNVIRARP